MADEKPSKFTLKTKLKAWWEGYDLSDLDKPAAPPPASADKAKPAAPARALTPTERLLQQKLAATERSDPLPWTPQRLQVAQYVWGEGFCGPGGPDYILKLSKMMGLKPEHSLLDVGCGLGGPARVLAREYGVWVDGLEIDEALAAAGQELSTQMGLNRKTQIMRYRFDVLPKLPRRYDRIFAKESLFALPNKRETIQAMAEHAKRDAVVLLTDYAIDHERSLTDPDVMEWARREPDQPHLTTAREYGAMLEQNGFIVRTSDDISAQYAQIIAQAWKHADLTATRLAAEGEDGLGLIDVMLREAEFWGRRAAALKGGKVQLHRITAARGGDDGPAFTYVR